MIKNLRRRARSSNAISTTRLAESRDQGVVCARLLYSNTNTIRGRRVMVLCVYTRHSVSLCPVYSSSRCGGKPEHFSAWIHSAHTHVAKPTRSHRLVYSCLLLAIRIPTLKNHHSFHFIINVFLRACACVRYSTPIYTPGTSAATRCREAEKPNRNHSSPFSIGLTHLTPISRVYP